MATRATPPLVTALDEMLADLDTPLDHVVALEAARDVLLERMKKRAAEQGRADDTPEAIAKRSEDLRENRSAARHLRRARPAGRGQRRRRRRRDQPPHHQPPEK